MRKLLLIIFFSSTVLAQDNLLSLNLEEAIEYGIENNRNLKNAEREIQFGTEQSAIGSVRMEQLLFDGSWLVGLDYSKIYLAGSENFYEKTFLQVRESIVKLYSLVVTLNEGIVLLENNLENFKKDLFEITQL